MTDAMSGHDLGLRGRVDAALRLAATTHAGHVGVNVGFISGLAMDLMEALAELRADPDIRALVDAATAGRTQVDNASPQRAQEYQ